MSASEVWDHVNATLDAAAWPAVALALAVLVIIFFRKQVGDRIKNAREVNVAGATVKMDPSSENEAYEALSETVVEVFSRKKPKAITAGPDVPADADEESEVAEAEARLEVQATITAEAEVVRAAEADRAADADDLIDRREQIEEIIRASWRAGVETGQRGTFADTPEPNIVWTGTRPEIQGFFGVLIPHERQLGMKSNTAVNLAGSMYKGTVILDPVQRLEDEIRRLRAEGADTIRKSASPDFLLYLELREKLRRLDPDSPFA